MIPYLILLFAPLLFSVFAITTQKQVYGRKWILRVGLDKKIRNDSLLLPVFFFIFFLMLALRDETIGRDLANYKYYFERFSSFGLNRVLQEKWDTLYWLLNWLVGQFTDDYQWFLVIVAAITVWPIAKIYSEDREHGFLKIILFVNMSSFVMIFSGLRQALAISIGLMAYRCVREKKIFWFLVYALASVGFHYTGFIVFAFYPLYHITIRKKDLYVIVPVILLIFIFNKPIFSLIAQMLNSVLGERYDTSIEETGSYTMLILFALFAILAFVFPDEDRMDKETLALRSFLLATVALQCFAPVHSWAMRMNYYFIIFLPILIPKILRYTNRQVGSALRYGSVAWWTEIVLIAFFALYFLYNVYIGCQTGVSALDTYPYVPFWQ